MPSDRSDFEDELWEAASSFHDATLVMLRLDSESSSLALTLRPEFDGPGPTQVTYEFEDVAFVWLENSAGSDDAFTDAEFPRNAVVDSFELAECQCLPDGVCYELVGLYAWRLHWSAVSFRHDHETA